LNKLTPIIPKIKRKKNATRITFNILGNPYIKAWIAIFKPSFFVMNLSGRNTLSSLITFSILRLTPGTEIDAIYICKVE
jgi:hypothetical protein